MLSQHPLISFTLLFSLAVQTASSLSFNFTSFDSSNTNITYERAYPDKQAIQLTRDNLASLGQATYGQPLHLWNKASGNLTDFTTNFSFVIDSDNRSAYGDGLAFFFAPVGTKLNSNITKGGGLGLATDDRPLNSTDRPFFAVEFDIYRNTWDPPGAHVGIDINSMESVANVTWWCDIRGGRRNYVLITYNSSTHNLSVTFTGFVNNISVLQYLNYEVDFRKIMPEWVTFGFSAATGNASALHSVYSWSFSSTLDVTTVPFDNRNESKMALAVGLGVGGFVLVSCLALLWFFFRKRNKRGREDDLVFNEYMDDAFEKGKGPKKFPYKELARATNNFREDQKLGQGGFGAVYRGILRDSNNSNIAVKRVSKNSRQGVKEYASEIKVISQLRHRNLVQLIGWCHEKGELLLVYEFMSNGSLDSHIFKENKFLPWEVRYRVAQGLASALLYLHEECEQCVVHRDIKSSNVMLDSSFNAKLGDFGLARLVDHAKGSQTTVLAGTMGYMAPEYVTTGRASKESDIFSFGVVALEIACGRKAINPKAPEDQVAIVEWVWELHGIGNILEAVDPKLGGDFNEREMKCLMIVGLWCAHPDSKLRPTIRQAIQMLNFEAPLLVLPPNMPVPTYLSFPPGRPPFYSPFSLSHDGIDSHGRWNQTTSFSDTNYSASHATSSSTTSSSATASLLYPH